IGPTSGSSLTLAGAPGMVNAVLATLTDTLANGTPTGGSDVVHFVARDSSGDTAVRDVGVQTAAAAPAPPTPPATPPRALVGTGIPAIGGVQSPFAAPGGLVIGNGGSGASPSTLLAALAPSAYSTASLTIGGTLDVQNGGTARFSGSLSPQSID